MYVKMVNKYYQKHKEKEAREAYENLSDGETDKNGQDASEQYRNLSKQEKEKKRQYGREQYKNLLEEEFKKRFSRMQEIKTTWV